MVEQNKIVDENFLCSGKPKQVARYNIQALDISTGDLYVQQKIPTGSTWVVKGKYYFQPIDGSGGVESVESSGLVTIDNTDPLNPILGFNLVVSDAIINANSPDALNPFATVSDITGGLTPNQVMIYAALY